MFTKEDLEQDVFYVNYDNENILNSKIEKTSFREFVMESVDETTTPKGVAPRFFVDKLTAEENEEIWFEDLIGYFEIKEGEEYFTISSWGIGGNHYHKGESFYSTHEAAELAFFQYVYDRDFLNDDQRDTTYFEEEDEARIALFDRIVDILEVSTEVAEHLYRKQQCLENLRLEKALKTLQEEKRRVEILAEAFAKLIEPQEESYKQTCQRLAKALDFKANRKEFHLAVKLIRKRMGK